MKDILAILAVSLFSLCHADAQLRSDRGTNDLFGAVHTIRIEKSPLLKENDRYVDGPGERSEVTYNKKGNKTEEIKYGAGSSRIRRSVFDYDTQDNLIAETVYNAYGSIYFKRVRKSIQVGEGRKIEESILSSGTILQAKTIYTYDKEGRGTELASLDAAGKTLMRQVTIYGPSCNPTELELFDDTSEMGKVIFSYDAECNLTGDIGYDAAGVRRSRHVFSGDLKRGSKIEVAEYDAQDNLVNKESYIREFDSLGNWTKETKSKLNLQSGKFEVVEVTDRIITYY